jgi:hypothetical protein
MEQMVYEAVAYAMRYWFIAVVVGILIAVIYISHREYEEKKYVKDMVSRYAGYLEIVGGPKDFIGDRFGIRERTSIGSSKKADIILPDTTVAKTHAMLRLEDEDLMIYPAERTNTKINGRRAIQEHRLRTGDIVSIGDVDLVVYIKRTRIWYDH